MLGMVCLPLGTKRPFPRGNNQPLRRDLAALTYETNARGSSIWYGRASDFCPGHLWNLPWLLHQIRQRHDGRDEFTKDAPRLARLPRENSLRIPWEDGDQPIEPILQDRYPSTGWMWSLACSSPIMRLRYGVLHRLSKVMRSRVLQQEHVDQTKPGKGLGTKELLGSGTGSRDHYSTRAAIRNLAQAVIPAHGHDSIRRVHKGGHIALEWADDDRRQTRAQFFEPSALGIWHEWPGHHQAGPASRPWTKCLHVGFQKRHTVTTTTSGHPHQRIIRTSPDLPAH